VRRIAEKRTIAQLANRIGCIAGKTEYGVDADWGAGDESDKWREWPSANSCVLSQLHRRDCGNASGGKRSALC